MRLYIKKSQRESLEHEYISEIALLALIISLYVPRAHYGWLSFTAGKHSLGLHFFHYVCGLLY